MKVLAIRSHNLASLAGEFEVVLDAPPLERAGLFAITGPTGSGKSTLLDALCLAFYGQTPRLASAGNARIADEISAADPRGVLRRGAGEGWAEAEFLDRFGERWRARWSVHRARKRPEGSLQQAQHRLWNTRTEIEFGAGRLRETQAEIERLLGLSREQFQRSVLLAQGDFAAFLRASGAERGDLLEQITGLSIYRELSKLAYKRERDAAAAVEMARGQLAQVRVLEGEERQALETGRADAAKALASAEKEIEAARKALDWRAKLAGLLADEAAADKDLQLAGERWEESAETRRLLAEIEKIAPLRPLAEALGRSESAAAKALAEEQAASKALEAAEKSLATAQAKEQAASETLAGAKAARQQAEPELQQARDLDRRIVETAETLAASRQQEKARANASKQAAAARDDLQRQAEAARQALAQAEKWLADNADIELLHVQWGRWRDLLRNHGEQREALAKTNGALAKIGADEKKLAAQSKGLGEKLAAKSRARDEASEAFQKRLQEAQALAKDGEDLGARMDALQAKGEALRKARDLAGDIVRERAQQAEFAKEAEARDKEAASLDAAGKKADQAEKIAGTRLKDAEAERERWAGVASLADRRGELLREGEACPLCGSEEHPWASHLPAVDANLEASRERARNLRAERDKAQSDAAQAKADAKAARSQAAKARQGADKLAKSVEKSLKLWREEVQALPESGRPGFGPEDQGALERLDEALETLRADFREAKALRDQRNKLLQDANDARDLRDKLDKEAREIADERAKLELAKSALASKQDQAKADAQRAEEAIRSALTALEDAFPKGSAAWRESLETEPGAFARDCAENVQAWETRCQAKASAEKTLGKLAPGLAAAAAEAKAKLEILEGARSDLQAREAESKSLAEERAKLLGGRSVQDEAARLDAAQAKAESALKAASDALGEAKSALAAANTRLANQQERLAETASEKAEASAALDKALSEGEISEERLRELLAIPEKRVREDGKRVEALDRARRQAETVLKERRRSREAHEKTGAPEQSAQALEEALAALEPERVRLGEALIDQSARLKSDDDARKRHAELGPEILAAEAAAKRWQDLGSLIGSADGAKFPRYAQGVTLGFLVDEANRRLAELAPRYRLARAPRQESDRNFSAELDLMVIDRDMGDERRPVNSLSGGETFLMSLALALGLSSLASGRARVGSLFIDEGFGTLDRDTLDRALALLESLPAALGCQVGIISHVEGLAERVAGRVEVEPLAAGRSRVVVRGAA